MRKRLWPILFLAFLMMAGAARAQFAAQWFFQDPTQNPQGVKQVYLTGLWNITIVGTTNGNLGLRQSKQTDAHGSLVISNLVYGAYRVDVVTAGRTNSFTNCFDATIATNSLIIASSSQYICVGTNSTSTSDYAYTRAQVNALVATNNGSGNVTGPNASTIGEIPYFDQNTGQHLGRSGILYTSFASAAFKTTNTFDLAGSWIAATNGYPWGALYDAANAGTTAATAATNSLVTLLTNNLNVLTQKVTHLQLSFDSALMKSDASSNAVAAVSGTDFDAPGAAASALSQATNSPKIFTPQILGGTGTDFASSNALFFTGAAGSTNGHTGFLTNWWSAGTPAWGALEFYAWEGDFGVSGAYIKIMHLDYDSEQFWGELNLHSDAIIDGAVSVGGSFTAKTIGGDGGAITNLSILQPGEFQEFTIATNGLSRSNLNTCVVGKNNLWTGTDGKQYVAWIDNADHVNIGQRNLATGQFYTQQLANTITNEDEHRTAEIGLDANGFIHLSYGNHADAANLLISQHPFWITNFSNEALPGHTNSFTYPMYFSFGNELYLTWRSGISGNGDQYLARYNTNTAAWVSASGTGSGGIILNGAGDVLSFYLNGLPKVDGTNCWFSYSANAGGDGNSTNQYLMAYTGAAFIKPTGASQTIPGTVANMTPVANIPVASALDVQNDFCVQSNIFTIPYGKLDAFGIRNLFVLDNSTGSFVERQLTHWTRFDDAAVFFSPTAIASGNTRYVLFPDNCSRTRGIAVYSSTNFFASSVRHSWLFPYYAPNLGINFDSRRSDGTMSLLFQHADDTYRAIYTSGPNMGRLSVVDWVPGVGSYSPLPNQLFFNGAAFGNFKVPTNAPDSAGTNAYVVTGNDAKWVTVVASSGASTPVIDENMEGTGTPANFTVAGGSPNFDNTSAPLTGAQDLLLGSGDDVTIDPGTSSEFWVIAQCKIASYPSAANVFCYLNIDANNYIGVKMDTSGHLKLTEGVSGTPSDIGSATSGAISTATKVWIKFHAKKGTGANAQYDVEWSATGTFAGSGANFTSYSSGVLSSDFTQAELYRPAAFSGAIQWDNVQIYNTPP